MYYRHCKGNVYKVVGEATHTETMERLVLYTRADRTDDRVWARPYEMFHGEKGGKPRFQPLDMCRDCSGTGVSRCRDPQCGDSTWDHYCDEGGVCSTCDGTGYVERG